MLRFGTIGTNFITDWMLGEAKALPGFELTAVYSRSMERAKEYASCHGAARAYDSLEALAADKAVDAVYIASPNACHELQALMMLGAGKHVLVEKPGAPTRAAFLRMLGAAQSSSRVLLEAMRPVFSPGLASVRGLLPDIGPVRHTIIEFCKYSSRYDAFLAGEIKNAFDPSLANGALMDMGVYCAAALIALFGPPAEVKAGAVHLHNGVDGAGCMIAVYPGMLAELIYSKTGDSDRPSEIQGERGTLLIDDICNPRRLTLKMRGMAPKELAVGVEGFGMAAEVSAFMEMAAGRADSAPYNGITLDTLSVLDAARAQTGIDFMRL